MREIKHKTANNIFGWIHASFWAVAIMAILFTGFYSAFQKQYENRVYPNVFIDNIPFGGKTLENVRDYWLQKNNPFSQTTLELRFDNNVATISGMDLQLGYDATLSATQAYVVGRSDHWLSNLYMELSQTRINLHPYFRWNTQPINDALDRITQDVNIPVENALFTFTGGRVTAFRPSKDGRQLNRTLTETRIQEAFIFGEQTGETHLTIDIPIDTVRPEVTTDKANTFGIQTLIGTGYSEFAGSIPGRIHNVALAANRINGVLIKPGETFSFNDAVGDISAATGYQSAYIIKDGHTVLGDGGGVCQVSTTLFRAALAAGLPIVERHAHDYRVHYYEEGGFKPGLDATVYGPTYDLKFKNDTPGYILIQTKTNLSNLSATFELYGTSDNRKTLITNIKSWDSTPAPPDLYQDDPTLPKGTIKQVDFSAWGLKTSFDYIVTRGTETLENTTFTSNFRPWQAVYLRGTL